MMKAIIIILYTAPQPGAERTEHSAYQGDGSLAACIEDAAGRNALAIERGSPARFWCAEAPSPLAPWRSLIPPPRPAGLTIPETITKKE